MILFVSAVSLVWFQFGGFVSPFRVLAILYQREKYIYLNFYLHYYKIIKILTLACKSNKIFKQTQRRLRGCQPESIPQLQAHHPRFIRYVVYVTTNFTMACYSIRSECLRMQNLLGDPIESPKGFHSVSLIF